MRAFADSNFKQQGLQTQLREVMPDECQSIPMTAPKD